MSNGMERSRPGNMERSRPGCMVRSRPGCTFLRPQVDRFSKSMLQSTQYDIK